MIVDLLLIETLNFVRRSFNYDSSSFFFEILQKFFNFDY
jgi:hypothetical protein